MDNRSLGVVMQYLRRIRSADADPQADQELLDAFAVQHDDNAFATLVSRHGPLVLNVCQRVLHNSHDAEDAFQATFLVLARKARSIRQQGSLGSWLYKVAYHLALRLRARLGRQREIVLPEPAPDADPADTITWRELRTVLDEELQQLPEKYRTPLLLCYLAGKTRDEAAEELGWSLGMVKGRLERGREMLRSRLSRRGLTLSAALLGTMLAANSANAAIPDALAVATIKIAALFAAGSLPNETASPLVTELAEQGLQTFGANKLKLALALFTSAIVVGSLTVLYFVQTPNAKPTTPVALILVPKPSGPAFADVTKQSGLEDVQDEHYKKYPKWWQSGMHFVDLDGDGHLDLFLSSHGGVGAVARNDGKGHFRAIDPQLAIPRGMSERGDLPYPGGELRLAYDFREKGLLDCLISWHDGGGSLYFNATKPGEPPTLNFQRAPFLSEERPDIRSAAIADIDHDGTVDLLLASGSGRISVHRGKGDGTFDPKPTRTIETGLKEVGFIPVDINGDGLLDLLVHQCGYNGPGRRILLNDGKGNFTDATKECGLEGTGDIHGVGDLNGDGFPDLICIEGQSIEIYLNDGKGHFTRKAGAVRGMEKAKGRISKEYGANWGGAIVVDIDNDGIPDILICGRNYFFVLHGLGGGNFELANESWGLPSFASSAVDEGVGFGDLHGQGKLDLVLCTGTDKQRRVGLFRNDLPEQHWLCVQPIGRAGNRAATGAKIRLYEAGGLDDPKKLLGYEQISVWDRQSFHSYYARPNTERHFGLGKQDNVDVSVEFYPSGKRVDQKNVKANAVVEIRE